MERVLMSPFDGWRNQGTEWMRDLCKHSTMRDLSPLLGSRALLPPRWSMFRWRVTGQLGTEPKDANGAGGRSEMPKVRNLGLWWLKERITFSFDTWSDICRASTLIKSQFFLLRIRAVRGDASELEPVGWAWGRDLAIPVCLLLFSQCHQIFTINLISCFYWLSFHFGSQRNIWGPYPGWPGILTKTTHHRWLWIIVEMNCIVAGWYCPKEGNTWAAGECGNCSLHSTHT